VLVETYSDLCGRRRRMNDNRFATLCIFMCMCAGSSLILVIMARSMAMAMLGSDARRVAMYGQQHVTLFTCSLILDLIISSYTALSQAE
jgi:hypothetical protein